MPKPLISILTPFKNTEKYLASCIESIQEQHYSNWELMIVDDSSTDNSYSVVKSYAEKDPRIKLLKNAGNGIIDALRMAFKNCNGDYITRMDSDDIMHEDKLQTLLDGLLKHGRKHVAVGLVKYFSKEGISNGYARYETWLNNLTKSGTNYTEIYKECVIPSPCWMIHREDFIAADAFNPNRYPEDYDLTFRFYKQNFTCIPCDKEIHLWRDYSTRTSRTHEHYAQNYFLDIKLHYFLELDYDKNRLLTIWGAGKKGKTIAKALVTKGIPFYWICNNKKKIGKHIYNQELHSFEYLKQIENPQCIVTVANAEAQKEIRNYFKEENMLSFSDYFFFC
ncbi:glycosyltransferase family 2 protein [Oceanihabitans sediminis]|uniref:Glycosyltransferase family 2 protein n=1 Tax=Oceanihabitans sediminis TaxID=1812012 RepID=A0A368P3W2_9FLAO|nr:glycosyltransferase family 2 protein [Oceanihabitans sediminis]MDX1277568.1 glycosyltransferase family 2 protein [Oceanihabitans sediminis]MDX1773465.1 glycosyltransferase family 2 protein [Oceanihabitans sediminis]RBP32920.1 glycosyltransferase involved in cell wall biosynthesis [Oceanihabitans sediminis]RCU57557.1 glycosyltransferase family 2 protein [Oceanihabitans sediminis]